MEHITYQRPREKAQHEGIEFLTTAELIQLIIGSGTVSHPVAKIARSITQLLIVNHGALTHRDLLKLKGVGSVSAWRIIAALQLSQQAQVLTKQQIALVRSDFHSTTGLSVGYGLQDEAGRLVYKKVIPMKTETSDAAIARTICADALAKNVASIQLALYHPVNRSSPNNRTRAFISDMQVMTDRLAVSLPFVVWYSKTERRIILGSTP